MDDVKEYRNERSEDKRKEIATRIMDKYVNDEAALEVFKNL